MARPWKLVSWNVLAHAYTWPHLYARCTKDALDEHARRARIVDAVIAFDADVVALQEVDRALAALLRARFEHVHYVAKGLDKPDGCALVARAPFRSTSSCAYDDGTGHVAALASVDGPEAPVLVATTHFKWDPPDTPPEKRVALGEASSLAAHLASLHGDGARVVCGDFNVTADDAVLALLLGTGFVDTYAHTPAPTAVANGRARRIDFILTTPDVRAVPLDVTPLADDSVLPSTQMPSDHVPIAITVG